MKKLLLILSIALASLGCSAKATHQQHAVDTIVECGIVDTVSVSTSEVAALYTTAKEIIPAPGPNKIIIVIKTVVFFKHHTAMYTTPGSCYMVYGTSITPPNGAVASNSFKLQTNYSNKIDLSNYNSLNAPFNLVVNQPICLRNSHAITGTGDTDLKIIVTYQIVDYP